MDTTGIDLLNLIGTKIKKVASTNGGEYHGACPFCGGSDRFIVQPHARSGARWFCRQCSPKGGDAIAFIQKRDGIDFKTALDTLGLSSQAARPARKQVLRSARISDHETPVIPTPAPLKADYISLNDDEYQRRADAFITESLFCLKSKEGRAALEYLRGRGLSDATIGAAEIGYNPIDRNETWGAADVYLPAGIVIPWEIGGQYWRVNFRRMGTTVPKGQRYISAKGFANGLYNADDIRLGSTVVMVEGEFDALAIRTGARALLPYGLVAVATGSAGGARILRWVARLSLAERVLLAFDTDQPGQDAAAYWSAQLGAKAIRLTPTAHDVNDMLKAGADLAAWIESAAPELASKPAQKPARAEIREIIAPPYVESLPPSKTPEIAFFSSPTIDYRAMNKAGRQINPFSADYDRTKLLYQVTP